MHSYVYSGTISSDSWGDGDKPKSRTSQWKVAAKWLPGSIAIMILLIFPANLAGEVRNFGNYDPIRYREWLYAKIARNPLEGEAAATTQHGEEQKPLMMDEEQAIDMPAYPPIKSHLHSEASSITTGTSWMASRSSDDGIMKRELGPKLLCFLVQGQEGSITVRIPLS